MPRRFDSAKVERVVAFTAEGYSSTQIADMLGMSASAVVRHRAYAGVEAPSRLGRPIKCDVEQVVALTRAGYTAEQIGQLLGVNERTVVRHRVAQKIAQPRPVPLSESEKRQALAFLDDGASAAEVARTLGRSPRAIREAFPGRAWTRQQVHEYISATRRFRGVLERSA